MKKMHIFYINKQIIFIIKTNIKMKNNIPIGNRNPNLKLFKLLNDPIFWTKFEWICLSQYRVKRLRECRTKNIIPRNMLNKFVEEDYSFITWDNRPIREIILELLSE